MANGVENIKVDKDKYDVDYQYFCPNCGSMWVGANDSLCYECGEPLMTVMTQTKKATK